MEEEEEEEKTARRMTVQRKREWVTLVDYWVIRTLCPRVSLLGDYWVPVGRMVLSDKHALALLLSYVSGWPFALL